MQRQCCDPDWSSFFTGSSGFKSCCQPPTKNLARLYRFPSTASFFFVFFLLLLTFWTHKHTHTGKNPQVSQRCNTMKWYDYVESLSVAWSNPIILSFWQQFLTLCHRSTQSGVRRISISEEIQLISVHRAETDSPVPAVHMRSEL